MATAVERHIALIGFMVAGKTTFGRQVAVRTGRPFIDLDAEIERRHGPIPELFRRGEPEFRRIEAAMAAEMLARSPSVIALGGGGFEAGRSDRALTVLLDVDVETAWRRSRKSGRPLAEDETTFRRLFAERDYRSVADAVARDADDVLLAGLGIELGAELDEPGAALIADEQALQLHPREAGSIYAVRAKTLEEAERLWGELRIGRDGTIIDYGGGSATDLAGFVAATYMRGVRWIAVPTTLVGQVDAAIGGKTAVDLPAGKNLVGAFHYPDRVVVEPGLLSTLPERERRNGLAEVVKTGLLAGRPLWELPEPEMIRACAAFRRASQCLRRRSPSWYSSMDWSRGASPRSSSRTISSSRASAASKLSSSCRCSGASMT